MMHRTALTSSLLRQPGRWSVPLIVSLLIALLTLVAVILRLPAAHAKDTQAIAVSNEWVNFYSSRSWLHGEPLPVGAVVRAYDPTGVQAGEFTVAQAGWYGLMPVYRDDPDTPEDEGLRPGEEVSFTINGIPARPDGPDDPIWTTNGALKQVNLVVSSVRPTNEWVNFYSQNTTLNGQPVPVGTLIEAFDPQGTKCGETIVHHVGWYGLLPCYRDDPDTPEDEGAVPGDMIAFRIAGALATASGPAVPQWMANGDIRQVDLAAITALTPTITPTRTLTATPRPTSTNTPTSTPRPSPTNTATNMPTPSRTPSATATPTPTNTLIPPTAMPSPTNTPTPTSTPTDTPVPPTETPMPTDTPTTTPVPSTETPTPTVAPTWPFRLYLPQILRHAVSGASWAPVGAS